jgi:3-deoxy-7-phosphoheptulonate synthase
MKEILTDPTLSKNAQAAALVGALPELRVETNYNFPYPEHHANDVVETMALLRDMPGITTLENILQFRRLMSSIATGKTKQPLIMTKSCHEDVYPLAIMEDGLVKYTPTDILEAMVDDTVVIRKAVKDSVLSQAHQIHRDRGEYFKPRSKSTTTMIINGEEVEMPAFGGHGVNSEAADVDLRTPNPVRAAEAAIQSDYFEKHLQTRLRVHPWAAHEALSLLYEVGFLRFDDESEEVYSASADMLWLGNRTNSPFGDQANVIKGLANVTGSKLGPDTDSDLIQSTEAILNPKSLPGKHVYMIRVPNDATAVLGEIAAGLATYAPEAVILNDVHGITHQEGKWKIRAVDTYVENTRLVATALRSAGLVLHGHALETVSDYTRKEWVDHEGEVPTHEGNIDPRANSRQTTDILNRTAEYLL